MKTFSVTQATNISAFAGALLVVINFVSGVQHGVEITQTSLEALIGALIVLGATAINFVNRYSKGDVTPVGTRKKVR